jgi:hypothetical protein
MKVNPPRYQKEAAAKGDKSFSVTDDIDKKLVNECGASSGHGNNRSVSCIKWAASLAAEAFQEDKDCAGKVTVPIMMCIFKKEVTQYARNPCVINGCGLAQMTEDGVSTVKDGFRLYRLTEEYDYFWDLVGRPDKKVNKCGLNRRSALDRDTSIAMAATHICTEVKRAKRKGRASNYYTLARDYNGSDTRESYGRWVEACTLHPEIWDNDSAYMGQRLNLKSECRKYNTCRGNGAIGQSYKHKRKKKVVKNATNKRRVRVKSSLDYLLPLVSDSSPHRGAQ